MLFLPSYSIIRTELFSKISSFLFLCSFKGVCPPGTSHYKKIPVPCIYLHQTGFINENRFKQKKAGSFLLSRKKSSIIGASELDFRVRNGNGYCLTAMATGIINSAKGYMHQEKQAACTVITLKENIVKSCTRKR